MKLENITAALVKKLAAGQIDEAALQKISYNLLRDNVPEFATHLEHVTPWAPDTGGIKVTDTSKAATGAASNLVHHAEHTSVIEAVNEFAKNKAVAVKGAALAEGIREQVPAVMTELGTRSQAAKGAATAATTFADTTLMEAIAKTPDVTEAERKAAQEVLARGTKIHVDSANKAAEGFASTATKIGQDTGHSIEIPKQTAKGAASAINGAVAYGEKGYIGTDAYGEKNAVMKKVADANATFQQASTTGKVIRGVGTVVSLGAMYSGAKDIYAGLSGSRTDDSGKEVPAGMSDIVVGSVKELAGAGGIYLSLIKGGRAKATGMSA